MATKRKGPGDEVFDFIGFAPDAPVDMPGACSVMEGMIPTRRGWRAAPSPDTSQSVFAVNTAGYTNLTSIHFGLDNEMFVGANGALYRHRVNTVGTVTGGLTLTSVMDPVICNFGNYVIMSHDGATISAIAYGGTAFERITGGPSSVAALFAVDRFVMALYGNTWKCCARDNHASWTLNPATLCATGQLVDDMEDSFKAGVAIGKEAILLKPSGSYRGRFEPGNEEVFVFEPGPTEIGAVSWKCAKKYKEGMVCLGRHGLFYYDGGQIIDLMEGRLRKWWYDYAEIVYHWNSFSIAVDEQRDLIFVNGYFTPPGSTSTEVLLLACHPPTKRWSVVDKASNYVSCIAAGPSTYPKAPVSATAKNEARMIWIGRAGSSQQPRCLARDATANAVSQIVTNDFGHPFGDIELTRANLKFIVAPTGTAPIATGLYRNNLDDSLVTATPVPRSSDGHFDVRQQARWHRLQFDLYGDWELDGYAVDAGIVGVR